MPEPKAERVVMAPAWESPWLRLAVGLLGAFYVTAVWLDAVGSRKVDAVLPSPLRFFVQEAALFPHAAHEAIEWRAEGYRCDLERFEEIDVRPFFPIHADDKENRFYRAMFFHMSQRPVLVAMDRFLVSEQNRAHPDARIGGVILLSLRIPIPKPGAAEERYRRLPLDDYPPAVERHPWYVTTPAELAERCGKAKGS